MCDVLAPVIIRVNMIYLEIKNMITDVAMQTPFDAGKFQYNGVTFR